MKSLRSSSPIDTIYINTIDYCDTDGQLVNEYLDKTLVLKPLQSIDYLVSDYDVNGTGANFIVTWGAAHDNKTFVSGGHDRQHWSIRVFTFNRRAFPSPAT